MHCVHSILLAYIIHKLQPWGPSWGAQKYERQATKNKAKGSKHLEIALNDLKLMPMDASL